MHEMVIQHEHQHNETMLQTIQLARLQSYGRASSPRTPRPATPDSPASS